MAGQTNLRVQISADIQDIKKNLGLVMGELSRVKQAANSSMPNTASWANGLAAVRSQLVGLAGAFVSLNVAGKGVRAIFSAFDRADRIEEVAKILGMTSEEVSRFAFGAKQAGVELEALKTGFFTFEKNLSKNEELLKELQITAPTAAGKIAQLADVFMEMGDSPLRAELAMKLFGRAGADLIPLLAEGSVKLAEFAKKSDEVGFTVSGKTAAAAAAFNDKLDVMKGTLTGVASQIGAALLPQLDNAVDGLQGVAKDGATTAGVAEVLKVALELMGSVASGIGSVLSGVGGFIASLGIKATDVLQPIRSLATALRDLGTLGGSVFKVVGLRIDQARARLSGDTSGRVAADRAMRDFVENQRRFWGAADGTGAMLTAAQQQKDPRWRNVVGGISETVNAAKAATRPLSELELLLQNLLNPPDKGGNGGKSKRAEEVKGIADAAALALDGVKASLELLEQMYADGQFSVQAYFAQREALQLEAIDLQIKQAQAEAATATSTDQQSRALTQVVKLQRERAAIGPQTARDQATAEKALTDQLELLRAKLADLNGGFGNEAAAQLQDQLEALLKKLGQSAEGADLAGKIFNIESAKARIAAIQGQAQAVIATMQAGTGYINAQMQLGAISPMEAERQLQAVRGAGIAQLGKYQAAALAALEAQQPGTPQHQAALEGLEQITTAIANAEAAQHRFGNDVAEAGVTALTSLFTRIREEGALTLQTLKAAISDFARSVYDLVARNLAESVVASIRGFIMPAAQKGAEGAAETATATTVAAIKTTAATTAAGIETAAASTSAAVFTAGAATAGGTLAAAGAALAAQMIAGATAAASILTAAKAAGSLVPSAKGNVFTRSGLQAFARGGIFDGLHAFANGGAFTNQLFSDPTIFRFGGGGQFGVMGEAGPEAVMPLSRGADGKLGVKSSGGGAGRPQRFVFVDNMRDAEAMMRGSSGEDAFLIHMEKNAGKVKEILS